MAKGSMSPHYIYIYITFYFPKNSSSGLDNTVCIHEKNTRKYLIHNRVIFDDLIVVTFKIMYIPENQAASYQ